MRIITSTILASSLLMTSAFADAPLAPGKPAGVKQAQLDNRGLELIVIGAGVLIGIGILIAIHKGDGTSSSSTASP